MFGALKKLFGLAASRPRTGSPPPEVRREAQRILTDDVVTGYRPNSPLMGWWDGASNLPNLWQMLQDVEAMCAHPRVSAALSYYKSGIAGAELEIEDASSPEHGEFALSEAKRFWQRGRAPVQRSYEYGRGGSQPIYTIEDGRLRLERMDAYHPLDTVVLLRNKGRQFSGVRVKRSQGASEDLWPGGWLPAKGFWHAHNIRYSRWYGMPQTYPAWRPWRRLAGRDGMEEVIDGGLYRFAYCGPVGRFPMEDNINTGQLWGTSAPTGQVLSNHDKMREFVENAKAGVSIAMSSRTDEHGNYLWDLKWPEHTLDVAGLLAAVDWYEKAISLGIGVYPELMEASEVGSGYSGRAIPLEAFYVGQQGNADEMLWGWAWQIGTPLLHWNYGPEAFARLKVKPLLESRMKALSGQEQQPGPGQQPPEQQKQPDMGGGPGQRFATAPDPWKPYLGTRGPNKGKQVGWKNSQTGRVVYGERKPGGPRSSKADPAAVKDKVKALLQDGKLTPAKIRDAVEDLLTLSVKDLEGLKKELGVRASGTKPELARKILERARTATPAEKPGKPPVPKPSATEPAPPAGEPAPAGPRPPRANFTGTDTLGRRWENGRPTGEVLPASSAIGRRIQGATEVLALVEKLSQLETSEDFLARRQQLALSEGKLQLQLELVKTSTAAGKKEWSRLRLEISALRQQQNELRAAAGGAAAAARAQAKKALDLGTRASPVRGRAVAGLEPQLQAEWGEAEQFLSGIVARGAAGEELPDYEVASTPRGDNRACYRGGAAHRIELSALAGGVSAAVHEAGHGIEEKMGGARAAVTAFLNARTAGDGPPVRFNEVLSGTRYDDSEIGNKDHFELAFGEKLAYYVGKRYRTGDTEILSMGLEKLHDDPAGFARADPEYCALIVGVLNGSLR